MIMPLRPVHWSNVWASASQSTDSGTYELELIRQQGNFILENFLASNTDDFATAPFKPIPADIEAYFLAIESRYTDLFTFAVRDDDAHEQQAEDWRLEFPNAETIWVSMVTSHFETQWLAVGFAAKKEAMVFKLAYYVDSPRDGEFDWE